MDDSLPRSPREPLVRPGEIDCHVADMTATISAQLPLNSAQAALAKFNQWIPVDGDPAWPVGRLVEENSSGPLRLGFGAWRDLLLGCQFRIGDGRLITAGGRTMKNVAGYDLVKPMVGQRGLLGKIENITARTYRRPEAALLAEFEPSDRWLGEIICAPLRPRYAILTRESLLCGWLDDEKAISLYERLAAEFRPRRIVRRSLDEDIQHRAQIWRAPQRHFRASVPPTAILEFAALAAIREWVADAAFGIVIGPYNEIDVPAIETASQKCGGSVSFFAPNRPPRWASNPVEESILKALKNAFARAG